MQNKFIIISCLVFVLLLGISCERYKPSQNDKQTKIEVRRYDRLQSRYLTTGDFSALQQMNIEYPIETRTLIERVLQLGVVDNPDISKTFLRFYQDSVLQSLISDVEAEYANMEDINKLFNESFHKLQEWIPDFPIPEIYAQITALDQSIVVGDNTIGISLDKYMGSQYPLYKKYYTESQRASMTREFIVPDCLSFYLLSLYPMANHDQRTQLEKDLHMGKVMWVVNKTIGKQFFKTPFVKDVDIYMSKHHKKTISELLESDNYRDMM